MQLGGGFVESKLQRGANADEPASQPCTLVMLWRSPLRRMYIQCGVLRILAEMGSMASPLCLYQIMRFLSDKDSLINDAGSHVKPPIKV